MISQAECSNEGSNFALALTVLVAISTSRLGMKLVLRAGFDTEKVQQLCGYASKALKNLQQEELVKAGLEAVGDLVRNFPQAMAEHVSGLLDFMVTTLKNPSLSNDLRICIYNTLSDISIACPQEVRTRLDSILQLYLFAFDAVCSILGSSVCQVSPQVDIDKLEYATQIKNSSIESFFYLIHGIINTEVTRDQIAMQKLGEFMKPLGIFLSSTLNEKSNPSEVVSVLS